MSGVKFENSNSNLNNNQAEVILRKARPRDIAAMQALVAPEVAAGVILPRADDVVATNIRSYTLAFSVGPKLNSEETENLVRIAGQSREARGCGAVSPDRKDGLCSSAESNLIGYCALHIHTAALAEVRSLIVSPSHRGQGVGGALVRALLDEARELGLKQVFALTYQDKFFEKLGFKQIPKTDLPAQKIWSDCVKCKHFPTCNEIALIYPL